MSNPWIDALYGHCSHLGEIAGELRRLGRAFDTVGNQQVACELMSAANDLVDAARTLRDAHSGRQMADLNEARRHQGEILKAFADSVREDRQC